MSIAALPTEHSMHNITKHESTWNFNSSTPQSIAFASVGTRSASFVSAPNADVNRTSKGDGAAWNWAGSTKLHSDEQNSVLEPNSEAELCEHLKETAHSLATIGRGGIKVLGSRLASSQLAVASDVNDPTCKLLSMEHCRGVVGFVESSNGEQLIEVLAGTQLGELFSYLLDHNLSLPSSPGVITYQTVGGVLASCTHGQGMKQSSISDCVDSVRVALASGEILVVQHDDDRINAFRASLGCLGIIISVRMHVVPARVLRCVKQSTDVESLIQNMTQWNYAHEYFKNWWFPATHAGANEGDIHLWRIDFCDNPPAQVKRKRWWPDGSFTEEYMSSSTLLPPASEGVVEGCTDDESNKATLLPSTSHSDMIEQYSRTISATIDATINRMQQHTRDDDNNASGAKSWTVKRFGEFHEQIGPLDALVCKQVPPRQVNFELSVPLSVAEQAMRELRDWFASPDNAHLPVHYPVVMRCTGGSPIWLSPAYGSPVCYLGFVVYMGTDGLMLPDSAAYLDGVQRLLLKYQAKPHWGKFFTRSLFDFPQLYEKWSDFAALRQQLDPHGMFLNPFLRSVFSKQ